METLWIAGARQNVPSWLINKFFISQRLSITSYEACDPVQSLQIDLKKRVHITCVILSYCVCAKKNLCEYRNHVKVRAAEVR